VAARSKACVWGHLLSGNAGSNPTVGVDCECRVLSGRVLCVWLITRPEESYRLWCVVCDREVSIMRRPSITGGLLSHEKKKPQRHVTARHGTARHSTARHGTARHVTAQHSTARHHSLLTLALVGREFARFTLRPL
jgi:hypothetical protein